MKSSQVLCLATSILSTEAFGAQAFNTVVVLALLYANSRLRTPIGVSFVFNDSPEMVTITAMVNEPMRKAMMEYFCMVVCFGHQRSRSDKIKVIKLL